jgi:hypothetical protein
MQEESVSEVRYYDVALSLPGERKKSRRARGRRSYCRIITNVELKDEKKTRSEAKAGTLFSRSSSSLA